MLWVLESQEPLVRRGADLSYVLKEGRSIWRNYYAEQAWIESRAANSRKAPISRFFRGTAAAARIDGGATARLMFAGLRRSLKQRLPPSVKQLLKRLKGRAAIRRGRVRFGSFDGTDPVSRSFGFDRGKPVDRYYVESFLSRNSGDISGRTLEIGDASYTRAFGGSKVQKADVLHVHAGNPEATIVGDLSDPATLPASTFDCLVLTQTLHLIYDMRAAVATMHRALKPGGVVLLTVPGISQIDRGEWGDTWFWGLTPAAARRLFGDVFGPENITVESHGNVYAATAFLQGLAVEEVNLRNLDVCDPAYPVIVTVRAVRAGG